MIGDEVLADLMRRALRDPGGPGYVDLDDETGHLVLDLTLFSLSPAEMTAVRDVLAGART